MFSYIIMNISISYIIRLTYINNTNNTDIIISSININIINNHFRIPLLKLLIVLLFVLLLLLLLLLLEIVVLVVIVLEVVVFRRNRFDGVVLMMKAALIRL